MSDIYTIIALPNKESREKLNKLREFFYTNDFRYTNSKPTGSVHITLAKIKVWDKDISNLKHKIQCATKDIRKFLIQPIEVTNKVHERVWQDPEMIKKYPQWCCWNALLFKDKSMMNLAGNINNVLDKIWINQSKEYVENIEKCLPAEQKSKEYIEHIADHMNISNYTRIEKWTLAQNMILEEMKELDIFIDTIALYSSENEIIWSYCLE